MNAEITLHSKASLVSTTKGRNGPRVLLVEDDENIAFMLGRCLAELADAQVTWAPDGTCALQLAADGGWDAIVTDIDLPGSSGFDLVNTSKRTSPHTATIMMTAHADFDHAYQALECGVDAFLVKPVGAQELVDRLNGAILSHANALVPAASAAPRTILAIGAHPDDVEIGCGATLLKHRAAGDRVVIATASRGAVGGATEDRARESEDASRYMGADLALGTLEDTKISSGGETIDFLSAIVREVKPDVVYTHSIHDRHQDHRAVHQATLVATRSVPSVYCYQSPSTTIDFRPTRFVDASENLEGKVELLDQFVSQRDREYLARDVILSTARYWGRFSTQGFSEPFEILREAE